MVDQEKVVSSEADLRKQLGEVENKLAEVEVTKAKLEGEMKDNKAAEAILVEAKAEVEKAKVEADRAQAVAEKVRQEAEKRPLPQPAPQPVAPPPPPAVRTRVEREDGGRCCCHPFTRTWFWATVAAVVLVVLGAVGYYFATRSQPAPVPSIYRVVPDTQGNPTLKKVGAVLWGLVGGVAQAEDKAVAVPEPAVILYDDKAKDLARAEAALQKAEADKAAVEKELVAAKARASALRSRSNASFLAKQTAEEKVATLQKELEKTKVWLGEAATERDNAREALKKAELAAAREDGVTERAKVARDVTALYLGYGQLGQVETAAGGAGKLIPRTEKVTLTEPIFGGGNRVTVSEITEPAGASGHHASRDRCAGTEVVVGDGEGGTVYYCAPAPSKESLTVPATAEDRDGAGTSQATRFLTSGVWGLVAGVGIAGANVAAGLALDGDASIKRLAVIGFAIGLPLGFTGGYVLSDPGRPKM